MMALLCIAAIVLDLVMINFCKVQAVCLMSKDERRVFLAISWAFLVYDSTYYAINVLWA